MKAHWTVWKLFAYITWLHLGEESHSFHKVEPHLETWHEVPGFGDALEFYVQTRAFTWWTRKVYHVIL